MDHKNLSDFSTRQSNGPFDQAFQYWQVGEQKTFNKLQAILWANGDLDKIHYYFIDEVWDQFNWSQKPTQSIAKLMNIRCRQLRDKYKQIRVAYSGGYDSQCILNSFVSSKIPVDGIFVRIKDFYPVKENLLAIQQATVLKNTIWPAMAIDIRYIHAQDFCNFYKQNSNDWINAGASIEPWFTKNNVAFFENYNKHYQHTPENFLSKASCDIYGYEKPKLWIENGNWYATMIDSALMWIAGANVENFYISSDLPELHHAQTWAMIEWIESQPFTEISQAHNFLHAVQSHGLGWDVYRDWNVAIGRGTVLNTESYKCGGTKFHLRGGSKNTQMCENLKKELLNTDKKIIQIWEGQLDDFLNQYSLAITPTGDLKGCWSKKYYIKPVEIKGGVVC